MDVQVFWLFTSVGPLIRYFSQIIQICFTFRCLFQFHYVSSIQVSQVVFKVKFVSESFNQKWSPPHLFCCVVWGWCGVFLLTEVRGDYEGSTCPSLLCGPFCCVWVPREYIGVGLGQWKGNMHSQGLCTAAKVIRSTRVLHLETNRCQQFGNEGQAPEISWTCRKGTKPCL